MNKIEKDQILLVENYAKTAKQITINDSASYTGLPVLETEYAIQELTKKYECKLRVTENGDIIYDFGKYLRRRDKKSFNEILDDALSVVWKGFTVFYKFMISAFLVVYFVVFLVIVLAAVVALMSGGKDERSNKGSGEIIYVLFRVFWSIFQWNTIMGYNQTYYRKDRYGYNYKHYSEKKGVFSEFKGEKNDGKESKGFVASVFDFVFGPPRVEAHPLENMQELATYLYENKGIVSTFEIQALAGWTREEAEKFMIDALANFNGKAEISPNGFLYGDFSELIRRKDKIQGAPIVYYWDEYEADYELSGNAALRDFGIIAMNSFNLILSGMILWGSLNAINSMDLGMTIFLGWVPFTFSLTFFSIPLIRWFLLIPKKNKQHLNNIRKRLMMAIFQDHTAQITLKQLTEIANRKHPKEEKLKESMVEKVMMGVICDLDGESFLNESGEITYKFEKLDMELDDMDEIRSNKKEDRGLGNIVFES